MRIPFRSFVRARLTGAGVFAVTVLLALGRPAPSGAAPEGVTLGAGGATSVRFSISVPEPATTPLSWAADVSALTLGGWEVKGRAGETALPVRVVTVAVPPTGSVMVEGRSGSTTTLEGLVLATAPAGATARGVDPMTDPHVRESMLMNRGRTASRGPDAPWAELLGVGWMRAQRVAQIAIHPVRYDLASRRLTVARTLDVTVSFTGTVPPATGSRVTSGPDAFEGVYESSLVNYEQGKAWRENVTTLTAASVPDTSIYAGRIWLKIQIPHSGFYRLPYSTVARTRLFNGSTTTPLDSLRLFTWPGYSLLPEANYCDSCDYREVAIQFEGDSDGEFNKNGATDDALYFYALGANDWGSNFDPTRPPEEYVNNPYDARNFVFLTIATSASPVGGTPHRIGTRSGAPGDTTTATRPVTFLQRSHFEHDNQYAPNAPPTLNSFDAHYDVSGTRNVQFWEKWFWRVLNITESFATEPADLPGADLTQPARFRALYWGLAADEASAHDHYVDMVLGGQALPRLHWTSELPYVVDMNLTLPTATGLSLQSTVPLSGRSSTATDQIGLGWYDIFYQRRFQPVNDVLEFDSPGGGDRLYDIGPFTAAPASRPHVFDITDPLAPVEVMGFAYDTLSASTYRLRFRSNEAGPHRYRIVPASDLTTLLTTQVADAPNTSLINLRSTLRKADYVVIYFDDFAPAAQELVQWRSTHLPLSGSAPYDTASVPISALYDQFSGGRLDPTAIRNFLRATYYNWRPHGHQPPAFVTLLGDASSDFKNITGSVGPDTPGSLVPTSEGGWDDAVLGGRPFTTDDWLLNVDNPALTVPDFYGGRIPVQNLPQAVAYVHNKLIPYESSDPLGTWRNEIMFIADDNIQAGSPGGIDPLTWQHVWQTNLLDTTSTPPHIDRDYVFLHRYKTDQGGTKNLVKAAIIDGINEGRVMVNFVGHGSPYQITDERVYLPDDAAGQHNLTRPTVFVAASCDVGKFNDPLYDSIGEKLVLNSNGGAVAVVSATEVALSSTNADLNRVLYREIFRRDSTSGHYTVPLSQGLLKAKTGNTNNQKYQVMGDAGVRLLLPWDWVELTFTDANDVPVSVVSRGQTLHFRGRILDRPGGSLIAMNGKVDLLIEDSQPIEVLPDPSYHARLPAAAIYRGDVEVRGGVFSGKCIVPVDALAGTLARGRGYLTGEPPAFQADGVGSTPYTLQPGTPPPGDNNGPSIALSFPGGSKSVRPDAVLRIDVADTSGVLITDHSPQNGIIVTVDGSSTARYDVTSSFRYATNSYQAGTASFTLPGLSHGAHTISVSAADNLAGGINAAAHRSSQTIDFEVSDNPALAVTRTFLFPNPTVSGGPGSGGTFIVDVPGDSVNVLLRLYTVSGRLIRTLTSFGSLGQVQIPWDGLDAEGDRLANGVYLYRVHVNPRDPDGSSSPRQKATGEGRVVIVRH